MVTKLYSAESFYVAQKSGKVARYMEDDKKLRKDNKGFYLNKSKSNWVTYKERVDNKDMVYARSAEQGVTKYSKTLDYDKKSYGVKESISKHNKHAHMSDLETSTGKVRRV
jgi:hypothetical protein